MNRSEWEVLSLQSARFKASSHASDAPEKGGKGRIPTYWWEYSSRRPHQQDMLQTVEPSLQWSEPRAIGSAVALIGVWQGNERTNDPSRSQRHNAGCKDRTPRRLEMAPQGHTGACLVRTLSIPRTRPESCVRAKKVEDTCDAKLARYAEQQDRPMAGGDATVSGGAPWRGGQDTALADAGPPIATRAQKGSQAGSSNGPPHSSADVTMTRWRVSRWYGPTHSQ